MNAGGVGKMVDPTRNMLNYGPSAAAAPFKSFISKSCHDPVLSSGKILRNLVSLVPGLPLLRGRNSLWQSAQIRFARRRIGAEFPRDTFTRPLKLRMRSGHRVVSPASENQT